MVGLVSKICRTGRSDTADLLCRTRIGCGKTRFGATALAAAVVCYAWRAGRPVPNPAVDRGMDNECKLAAGFKPRFVGLHPSPVTFYSAIERGHGILLLRPSTMDRQQESFEWPIIPAANS